MRETQIKNQEANSNAPSLGFLQQKTKVLLCFLGLIFVFN